MKLSNLQNSPASCTQSARQHTLYELDIEGGNEYACQDLDLILVHISNAPVTIPLAEIHALGKKKDKCELNLWLKWYTQQEIMSP